MAGPTDYVSPLLLARQGQQSPIQSLGQGMALGDSIIDSQRQGIMFQQAQQDRAAAIAAAKQQAITAAQKAVQVQEDTAKYIGDTPTTKGIAQMVALHPELADNYMKLHKELAPQEQMTRQQQASRTYALLQAGESATAIDGLKRDAMAYENSNRPDDAKALYDLAGIIENGKPEQAKAAMGLYLAGTMGPTEFAETFSTLDSQPAVKAKQEAEASAAEQEALLKTKTLLAEIGVKDAQADRFLAQTKNDAARLGLDWAKFAFDKAQAAKKWELEGGDLPAGPAKARDDAITASVGAAQSAEQTKAIASKFRELSKTNMVNQFVRTGGHGVLVDKAAEAFGIKNELGALRTQARALLNGEVLKSLPPGAASDTDIALIRAGVESEFGDFGQVADAFDAMERVQRRVQKAKDVEAAWLSENRGLGPARKNMVIDGIPLDRGTPFTEAMAKVVRGEGTGPVDDKSGVAGMTDEQLKAIAGGG